MQVGDACENHFIGAIPLRRGIFGNHNLQTVISGVSCNGSESKLLECQFNKEPSFPCGVFNDAAIVCQSKCLTSAIYRIAGLGTFEGENFHGLGATSESFPHKN